jgi:peptide-methionine (S)-S-oxide reductase
MRLSPGRAVRGLYRRLNPMTLTPTTIREYDAQAADRETTDTATFGLGCFWGPDARFGAMDGVVRTRVGYAGGTKPDPSYHSLGDHTEVVQVDFDPDIVTYRDLVEDAFQQHDPQTQPRKTQYQNVVFASTATQRTAVDTALAASGYTADGVETRLEQLSRFYPAEDYHQKYRLRSASSFLSAFEEAGYTDEEIRESPIAAKLNGYVAGHDVDIEADLPASDQHASG